MSDLDEEEDAYDDEGVLDASLAIPPVYVLRTVERCPECAQPLHVYALGCAAFHDAEELSPTEVFHFLHHIRMLPDHVIAVLKAKCRGYRFDAPDQEDDAYLINHCPCGARLDDEFLHGDVGAAFWPDTPAGFEQLDLFRLPIEAAFAIDSSFTIGGGEYLDEAAVSPWTAL